MRTVVLSLVIALAAFVAPACGNGDETSDEGGGAGGAPGCVPGTQIACACLGGPVGVQVCNATGKSYDACQCPDAAAGGAGGSDGAAGAAGSAGANPCPAETGDGACEICVKANCCAAWKACVEDTACAACVNCLRTMSANDCFNAGECNFSTQQASQISQCRIGPCGSEC